MEHIVVDSNIKVASLLMSDRFHHEGRKYINGLENGDYISQLPMLGVAEVISAISRQAQRDRLALLARTRKSISGWERDGRIILYPLDRGWMDSAMNSAQQQRLRGLDAVFAVLAEELDLQLKTFDNDVLKRCQRASV